MVENKKFINLFAWVGSLLLVSSILGNLTSSNVDGWYQALNRSSLTPPDYVFGIVWSILYVMIAISGWKIWRAKHFPKLNSIKALYIGQLILNWSWTPLFFIFRLTEIAFVCLLAIVILVTVLIIRSYKNLPSVSLLLTPYLLWLLLATYLNFYIWQFN